MLIEGRYMDDKLKCFITSIRINGDKGSSSLVFLVDRSLQIFLFVLVSLADVQQQVVVGG
jgi:hypothetical protein